MGSGATAKYALEYPLGTDPPNVPGDIEALANQIDAILAPYAQDLIANRPAFGKTGRTFTQTDGLVGTTWRDSGTDWRALGSRIQPNAVGDIGAIVRATVGQTADLHQWQSSATTPVAGVTSTGLVYGSGLSNTSPNRRSLDINNGRGIVGGTTTPATTATFAANSQAATDVVLLALGVASQSGDLQQWQSNSGGVLAGVTAGGFGYFGSATPGGQLGVLIGSATNRGAVIRAAASQTGHLIEWQDSTSAVLGFIHPTGSVYSPGLRDVTDTGPFLNTGSTQMLVTNRGAVGNTVFAVKGMAGQTGDLIQTESSTGAALLRVTGGGDVWTTGSVVAGPGATWLGASMASIAINSGVIGIIARGASGQTSDLQQWQDSTGAAKASLSAGGALSVQTLNSTGLIGGSDLAVNSGALYSTSGSGNVANFFGAALNVTPRNTTSPGAIIRGLASQTGDLEQWQNSAGSTLASIDSVGALHTNTGHFNGATGGWVLAPSATSPANFFPTGAAGNVGMYVRGAASQTADLQEWQNSAGTPLAKVDNTGQVIGVNLYTPGGSAGINIAPYTSAARLALQTGTTTEIGALIRGMTSQVGDLTQWQGSGGAVLSRVNSGGNVLIGSGTQPTGMWLSVATGSAGDIGAIIKGFSGQTGNLQQWQNSSGVNLVTVGPTGNVGIQAPTGSATAAAWLSIAPDSGSKGIVVRGASSQSVNLQEWQNSTPTVIAAVTNTGNVQGTGAYTTLSDASVKMNVSDLVLDPLDVIKNLRPVHFDYIGGMRDQVGFIANEVESVLPHAVSPWDKLYGGIPDYEGRLGLQTDAILAYAVGALQNIERRLAALEAR